MGQLGSGGMAEVYLAHDSVLDRDVAVKILHAHLSLDDDFVERFKREARSAASLQHPNIVQVYDQGWDEQDGTHFIAMEYIPGGTLKDIIRECGAMEPHRAAGLAASIARALHVAHTRGIIHRDIKPQNVLIDEGGQPKVADFGIARAASSATTAMTGTVMGTAGYMSPEQALGEKVSPRSDQYSLGVILYEMLVGELPHDADTPVAIAVKHVNEVPRPPERMISNLPNGLNALTMKLLSKKPEGRYPDAAALADDLCRVRDGLSPENTGSFPAAAVLPTEVAGDTSVLGRKGSSERDEDTSVLSRSVGRDSGRRVTPVRRNRGRRRLVGAAAIVALLLVFGAALVGMDGILRDGTDSVATAGSNDQAQGNSEAAQEPPDVVGRDVAAARSELEDAGFTVTVERAESSAADEGKVLEQSSGDGREVVLTVGDGPGTVATPNLIYASEAESQLSEADLALGEVTERYSDSVAEGVVISQNPANGEEVEPGTEVDITVSLGPEPAPVEPAPTQSAPAQSAPTQSATPDQSAPVESAPDQSAPTEDAQEVPEVQQADEVEEVDEVDEVAPSEVAPTEAAPSEAAPTETAPTETAPAGGTSGASGGEIVDDVFEDVGIE